jgi:hypothetical protein
VLEIQDDVMADAGKSVLMTGYQPRYIHTSKLAQNRIQSQSRVKLFSIAWNYAWWGSQTIAGSISNPATRHSGGANTARHRNSRNVIDSRIRDRIELFIRGSCESARFA